MKQCKSNLFNYLNTANLNNLNTSSILSFSKIKSTSKLITFFSLLIFGSSIYGQTLTQDNTQPVSFYILGNDFFDDPTDNVNNKNPDQLAVRITLNLLEEFNETEVELNSLPNIRIDYHACLISPLKNDQNELLPLEQRSNCFETEHDQDMFHHVDRKGPLDKIKGIKNARPVIKNIAFKKVKMGFLGSIETTASDLDQITSDEQDNIANYISQNRRNNFHDGAAYTISSGVLIYLAIQFGRLHIGNLITAAITGGGKALIFSSFGGGALATLGSIALLGTAITAGVVLFVGVSYIYRAHTAKVNLSLDQEIVLRNTQNIIDILAPPIDGELGAENTNFVSINPPEFGTSNIIKSEFSGFDTIKTYTNFLNAINN